MNVNELGTVASAMVGNGKGILAADESTPTIKKRFDTINAESTEENRRRYREMLFTTPGIADQIGGVILFDETLRQRTTDGVPFPDYLNDLGMLAGIKVDKGAKDLAGFPGEKITEGLDGLRERLAEYSGLGAKFAKWRAVINIGDGIPSDYCLNANAHALALVHHGGGRTAELVALAREIREGVLRRFSIDLQPEPVFLGFPTPNPLSDG